jgi:putative cell wall binding repeat protein
MHQRKPSALVLLVSCGVVLGAFPPSGASAAAAEGRVTANLRVGADDPDPFRGGDIPAVAADPSDPRHIVMVNDNFVSGECEFRVTFDGGSRWEAGKLKAPDGFPSPPCRTLSSGGYPHVNQSLAFGTGQNVYTVFDSPKGPQQVYGAPSFGQGQADSVLVARSVDGGRTFNTAVVAIAAPDGAPFPFYIRPTLGVQARPEGDRLFVAAWGVAVTSGGPADGAGDRRLVTASSTDGGTTWSAPVDASAPGEQVREPSAPVVGPDGAVYVAWRNRDTGAAPSNVIVGKSTDGGRTWLRNLAGAVTGLGQGAGGGMPELGVDRASGALYVVYQETEPYGDLDIFFQRSTDGGATWSSPVRVNDDPTGNKVRQHVPHMAVAANGRIDVVWLDHRHAYPTPVLPAPRGEADVYYANSSDGGRTFSANRRITDRTINLDMGLIPRVGSYSWFGPVTAPLGNDAVFFAWSDPRAGNIDTDTNDIYTATLHLGAGDQPETGELAGGSTTKLSVELSELTLPGGTERISNPPLGSRSVLVNEEDASAALAGAVLARAGYGSLLTTAVDGLSKEVRDEVARLRPAGVYVIGDESLVSARVLNQLRDAGARDVVRLAGADPAGTAVAVAEAMDLRSSEDRAAGKAAFSAVVIVDPRSADAAAVAGLAAALRFPILFTARDGLPAVTSEALGSLKIGKTLVVGGIETVSAAVQAALPGGERLGGRDAEATSRAVEAEGVARGLPGNILFVADKDHPVDAALLGATAARVGGLLQLRPGGKASAGGLTGVDRVYITSDANHTEVPWPLIVASMLLAILGGGLLVAGRRRRTRGIPTP